MTTRPTPRGTRTRPTRTQGTGRGIQATARKVERTERETVKPKKKKGEPTLIRQSPLYKALKPRQQVLFKSDYFQIDDGFATILSVFHEKGADDALPNFWGIYLIPRGLDSDVTVRRIEHVGRVSESWVASHQGRAEGLLNNKANEVAREGSMTSTQKLSKEQQQLYDIAQELSNGASYLRVAFRLLVKAPTLAKLDEAVVRINRQYKDRFDTLEAAPYVGEQRRELGGMFRPVDDRIGRNFMFTSPELAGSYSLVTRGIEDPTGEYIGQMEGDVNNSAVLMDLDKFESHIVIAGKGQARLLSNWETDLSVHRAVDLWGAKIGTAALVRNKRVVHLVLNRANVRDMGVNLDDITSQVDMTRGDINPFELFGEIENELSLFPAHLEKLVLMIGEMQAYPNGKEAIIKGVLKDTLNDFYVDQRMWARDAQSNRDRLRLVGIPHEQVPKLSDFTSYIRVAYDAQVQARNKDADVLAAYGFLRTVVRDMINSNGDLFNTTTSPKIDRATASARVVYDFSSLIERGRGVMMAQFINALSFAVGALKAGDLVVLHGAEELNAPIRAYVRDRLDLLGDHGVRVAFVYSSVERMLATRDFNRFDSADYTLLGGMTNAVVEEYQAALSQKVPVALSQLLIHKNPERFYLRRGFDNVVFANDLQMGFT